MIVTAGAINVTVYFYIVQDASATNPGEPVTGLLFSDIETGGSASHMRQGAARVDFTLVTLASASAAHTDGGFILVDDTNMPGVYRCDVPDAAFATGVDQVIIQLVVAAAKNAVVAPLLIDIADVDLRDVVRAGMTALPNAAAEAAGGLYTRGTGAGQINQAANGQVDANVQRLNNVAQSLLDLVDFADAGYDPAVNKVEGVKLVDTTTTNTDVRGTDSAALASVATEARLAELDAANLPTDIANVQSDTDNIQTRLPAALVSGRMDSSVGAMVQSVQDGIISAVSGTAEAGSSTILIVDAANRTETVADYWAFSLLVMTSGVNIHQVRQIIAFNVATDTLTVTPAFKSTVGVGDTYIILRTAADVATYLNDAIAADVERWRDTIPSVLIAGRVDANAQVVGDKTGYDLSAAGIDAIWDELQSGHTTAGTFGRFLDSQLATIQADTDNIQTRLPGALVGGRMDSSVGAMATDVITAAALAAAGANKLADHVMRRTYANARASADGDAVAFRSLLGAIGKLINRWQISGTTLTVFQEDDATSTAPGGTQTVTTDAAADPIKEIDTT